MTLGAEPAALRRMFLGQGLVLAVKGVGFGLFCRCGTHYPDEVAVVRSDGA
ncbi:MAG TPA: hypothetical protein VH640_29070 [Bryobacteraceae bacterium]